MTTARTRRNACVGGKNKGSTKNWRKPKMSENNFAKLASVDVSKHIEKKSNQSYLSWAWAVDQLMRHDPAANWEFHDPKAFGETMMVSCTVTAFGKPITMHLPVMDHRNQAVKNPDAFVVNKNMMRCLVKAIACHGLGLYIYAGEDLPMQEEFDVAAACEWIAMADTAEEAKQRGRQVWPQANKADHPKITAAVQAVEQRTKQAA